MADNRNRKLKLLKLLEIIRTETNESHPLTTEALCEKLHAIGITGDRRTVSEDIRDLNAAGYEVLHVYEGHSKAYYMVDRSFSIPEVKILMDAVQAANFITARKTEELTKKLSGLVGRHHASALLESTIHFNTRKHTNESIYYNVSSLEGAIRSGRKISFYYFDRDETGAKVYRKDKALYVENPVSLVYNNDNYYLICYNEKHQNLCHYRTDRMDHVNLLEEQVCNEALLSEAEVAQHTRQLFGMYGGTVQDVTLRVKKQQLGRLQDQFGEQLQVETLDDDTLQATVRVQISPAFWGWLFMLGGDAAITAPENLAREYYDRARAIASAMETMEA